MAIYFWMNRWANSVESSEGVYPLVYILLMVITSLTVIVLFYYVLLSPILSNVFKDMSRGLLFSSLLYF